MGIVFAAKLKVKPLESRAYGAAVSYQAPGNG